MELKDAVRRCVFSETKTYRYVLPTQLCAKLIDAALDCRCLQARRGRDGSWDARTIAHKVVVPFDQRNERVLGGSPEPYVNNPLRVSEVSPDHRNAQKNKREWDDLCQVLGAVEDRGDPEFTRMVFRQALVELVRRLNEVRVAYPTPRRISLDATLRVMQEFLSESSGGDRYEALTAALFESLRRQFSLFHEVRRCKNTAADAASGMVGDVECVDEHERIVLAIEAKDRALTIRQVVDKIPGLREAGVTEALFVSAVG